MDIGDIKLGRPNLGDKTTVAAYRMMQYALKAVLEKDYGHKIANDVFRKSGKVAGINFCKKNVDINLSFSKFIARINELFFEYLIGVLRIEESDEEKMKFVITISEDLDCSGLPVLEVEVCDFDEGFFEGIFEYYTKDEFFAKEIDCWATGGRTCRFTVEKINSNDE